MIYVIKKAVMLTHEEVIEDIREASQVWMAEAKRWENHSYAQDALDLLLVCDLLEIRSDFMAWHASFRLRSGVADYLSDDVWTFLRKCKKTQRNTR